MYFETQHLILRPFEAADLTLFSEINANAKVMRFFGAPYTTVETADMIARCADKQTRYGYAFSAVVTYDNNQLIGMAGLSRLEDGVPFAPCTEIGWRLTPSAWHNGYTTEAALAWLDYGFQTLGLTEVLSYTPELNIASYRVMQRLGMQRVADLDFDYPSLPEGDPLRPMLVCRMTNQAVLR
jgi:RimJ/RimL family protein N-acetyltransferase